MVEVLGNPSYYGVIKWIGYTDDKSKPLAGLEMEVTLFERYLPIDLIRVDVTKQEFLSLF